MTLMGTWITGYWNGLGLEPGKDYDFFPFPSIAEGVPGAVVGPVDGLVISNDGERAGAEAFLSFMMSNADVQASWTGAYGALSANVNVDPANYNDVMQRVSATVAGADVFAFNYDLATPPPVAEVGPVHVLALHGRPEQGGRHPGAGRQGRGAGVQGIAARPLMRKAPRELPGGLPLPDEGGSGWSGKAVSGGCVSGAAAGGVRAFW